MSPQIDDIRFRLQESLGDEYEDFAEIASGGMGVVFRARHRLLEREDAIKVLFFAGKDQERERRRFYDEARIIAALAHPNIRQVFGARHDRSRNLSYLLMAFVDGESLKDRLRQDRLPLHTGLSIARQVTDALQYAHFRKVVHRDIKPANILIDVNGNAFLADFGIALDPHVTLSATLPGTPHYMAPELMRNARPGPVTDIFALGHVLSEIFTGRRHDGDFVEESDPGRGLHRYLELFEDHRVAKALHALVDSTTSREPERRPRSCGEVLRRLARVRELVPADESALASALGRIPRGNEDLEDDGDSQPRVLPTGGESSATELSKNRIVEDRQATSSSHAAGTDEPASDAKDLKSDASGSGVLASAETADSRPFEPDLKARVRRRNRFVIRGSAVLLLGVGLALFAYERVEDALSLRASEATDAAAEKPWPASPPGGSGAGTEGRPGVGGNTHRSGMDAPPAATSGEDASQPDLATGTTETETTSASTTERVFEAEPLEPPIPDPPQRAAAAGGIRTLEVRLVVDLGTEAGRMPLLLYWRKGSDQRPDPVEFRSSIVLEGEPGDAYLVKLVRRGLTIEPDMVEVTLDGHTSERTVHFKVQPDERARNL